MHIRDMQAGHRSKPDNGIWPWGTKAAVFTSPIILVVLLLLFLGIRYAAGWPSKEHEGTVLIVVLVLAALPLLLIIAGPLIGGGSIEAFGLRVVFPQAPQTRHQMIVPPQLGMQAGAHFNDSSTTQILDTLNAAVHNEVAVLNLEKGGSWWETRLLVLCSGAVRLGSPKAIVFLMTAGLTQEVFIGWAKPERLLDRLLTDRPEFRLIYEKARSINHQWDLAIPTPPFTDAPTPPLCPPNDSHQVQVFPLHPIGGTRQRNPHAAEQILAIELGPLENKNQQGDLTPSRLSQLFEHVLHTRSIDLDATPTQGATFADAALATTDPFLALTRGQRYEALLSRERIINEILLAILSDTPSDRRFRSVTTGI